MKHSIKIFMAICLLAFGQLAWSADISQEELLDLAKSDPSILILDVRTPREYAAGHVPGAKLIPHTELRARLREIADHKTTPVVVYCKSGRRAAIAQAILDKAGFADVRHLEGDMNDWKAQRRPIER